MEVKGVVLSLARVHIPYKPRHVEAGSWEGKRMVELCTERIDRASVFDVKVLKDHCHYFNFCIEKRPLDLVPARHGLVSNQVPVLEVRRYGFGLTSYRVTINVLNNLDETSKGWRRIIRSVKARIEKAMKADNVVKEELEKTSHYFAEVYPVIELEEQEYRKAMVLGYPLDEVLVKELVAPLKRVLMNVKVRRDYVPEEIYVSRDGFVLPFFTPAGKGDGTFKNQHVYRRRKRRVARMAVDLALGLKVFLENLHAWPDFWAVKMGLIFLNPHVLLSLGSMDLESFEMIYWRIYNALSLDEAYHSYHINTPVPQEVEPSQVHSVKVASMVLSGRSPDVLMVLPINDYLRDLLSLFALKREVDMRLYLKVAKRGKRAKQTREKIYKVVLDELTKEVFGEACEEAVGTAAKKMADRERGLGFSAMELEILMECKYEDGRTKLRRNLAELLTRDVIKSNELRRRGVGRPSVKIYEINWDHPAYRMVMEAYKDRIDDLINRIKERMFGLGL